MKKYNLLVLVLISISGFSQSLSDYKYAIVPSKFSFLKEKDQYRMNMLTKMFMEKYGFITYFDTDILPTEVAANSCNRVFVDVQSNGGFFTSNIVVTLKDCRNSVIFTSAVGKSREKDFQISFNQALREAFNSFDNLDLKSSIAAKSETTNAEQVAAIPESNPLAPQAIVIKEGVKSTSSESKILFAQPIDNGFQLIDSTPKVVMKIYKTSIPICFMAIKENVQGVLIFKENHWFFEYLSNSKLISEKVEVKF
jgi:hypothetical protein